VHVCEARGNFSGIIPSCALQAKANITTTFATCDVVGIRGSNANRSDCIARLMLENCTVVCAEGYVGVATLDGIIPSCALQAKANITTTFATCDVVGIRGSNVNTSDCIARLMLENCTVVGAEGCVGVATLDECNTSGNFSWPPAAI
jgi:hypothetical protein